MGYGSSGKKPIEFAGKTGHSDFIDEESRQFLSECYIPQENFNLDGFKDYFYSLKKEGGGINYVVAIDGGYSEATVKRFPSSKVMAVQIGALLIDFKKIKGLEEKTFISPEEMNNIKDTSKSKFILPVRNIMNHNYDSFTKFVRETIFKFFIEENFNLASALKWLIFREFYESPVDEWNLATHPIDRNKKDVKLRRSDFKDYIINVDGGQIYITDVLRLHERIDDDTGSEGVVDYLLSAIEQILMISIIKEIYAINPCKLSEFLFILDRPLAFFGQTANLHKPMREMISYFISNNIDLNMVGIEKNGPFVEHARVLTEEEVLEKGKYILLNNDYIYRNILPRSYNNSSLYGETTYYGGKLIFNSNYGNVSVCTVPVKDYNNNIINPHPESFVNLNNILSIIEDLKCDMYENAILPITLVNNAVSISKYPGGASLQRLVRDILCRH